MEIFVLCVTAKKKNDFCFVGLFERQNRQPLPWSSSRLSDGFFSKRKPNGVENVVRAQRKTIVGMQPAFFFLC